MGLAKNELGGKVPDRIIDEDHNQAYMIRRLKQARFNTV